MMRKLSLLTVTMLLLTILLPSTLALAAGEGDTQETIDEDLNVDNGIDIEIGPLTVREYPFSITVPSYGSGYSESTYTMSPGKYLRVRLDSSTDNYSVTFTAVDASTHTAYGTPTKVYVGDKTTIYTNTSGVTQNIAIRYSAVAPFELRATGVYIFGEF